MFKTMLICLGVLFLSMGCVSDDRTVQLEERVTALEARVDSMQNESGEEQDLVSEIRAMEIHVESLSRRLTEKNPKLIAARNKLAALQAEQDLLSEIRAMEIHVDALSRRLTDINPELIRARQNLDALHDELALLRK